MRRHNKLILVTILVLLGTEVTLMEVKYQLLSGDGFLQAAPLSSPLDMFFFFFLFLGAFVLLYALVTTLARKLFLYLGFSTERAEFIAGALFVLGYGTTMMATYKLHQYVADHVDKTVINAIAGNDLKTAIAYVKDEIFIFSLPIILFSAIAYLYMRSLPKTSATAGTTSKLNRPKFLIPGLITILIAAYFANWPTHLNANRTTSYNLIRTAAHTLTDWDLDGSSFYSIPADPAPLDSDIYWGAVDIPGNGIDENGLGGDLPTATVPTQGIEVQDLPSNLKHLVLVVAESARADMISHQVDGTYVAPNLRALAATGSSLADSFSHAGFTANSLYTLFAGKYEDNAKADSLFKQAAREGIELSVISGQDETWGNLDSRLGTRASATYFYDPQEDPDKRVFPSRLPSSIKLADATLVEAFKRRLNNADLNKRQFFYVNFQAAHFPYFHQQMSKSFVDQGIPRRQINKENEAWLRRTYWNALAYTDTNLGKLIEHLKSAGIWDKTLLVFTGDHGESLFHDGFLGHGHNINRDQLQIPLVMSAPGIRFSSPTGLIDLHGWLSAYLAGQSRFEKSSQCAFFHTGSFNAPAQIGELCRDQKDIRVYTVAFNQFSIGSVTATETKPIALIHRWERALYNETHNGLVPFQ